MSHDGARHEFVSARWLLSTSIRLTLARTGRHSERRIVLGDASPSARAGVLALAAAELVRSDGPLLAATETWMRGAVADAGVHVTPASGVYADLRLVTEARLQTAALSATLALELGRASGYVARSAERALGATGGFFVGGSLGGSY
jgi:hypothetical protein